VPSPPGETAGTRALLQLGGLVPIAFGVVLLARPGVGALTLALLYGLFALTYGVTQIAAGIQLRSAGAVSGCSSLPRRRAGGSGQGRDPVRTHVGIGQARPR
jgi:hypothetical protein